MAETVLSVAAKMAAEPAANAIARQVGYIRNYKSNFQNLEKQVQKLQGTCVAVQHLVEEAKRNGEEIEHKVVNWLDSVNKLIDEVAEVITDNNRANMRCLKSLCPDLKKRYQHSKKAAVKAMEVSEFEKEGNFDKVSYRNPPKEIWHPANKLFEDFESRRSTVENILKELLNPNVNMVGVYGMGGIGKTTLAKEVGKQTEEQRLFDVVVFVEVSEKDIMKIQEAIANKLGLEFRENEESGRARTLCGRLKKESKILLILDNLWKRLDLEKVGIPVGNDHPGCKLLLTARSSEVLSNAMNSCKNFSIGDLNESEAWNLFQKVAGACVEQHGLQHLAFEVAKRCGRLPVAIVTIAKALKDKRVQAWRDASRELGRPSPENLVGSVTAEAYSCIQLSYNHLENDELKSTFLLCSTIGSDASVENLLRYGMGLNLFRRVYTVEDARDRVYTLVQKLKDSSLLLDTSVDGEFSIHDVVRDVGRSIGNNFIVNADLIPRNLVERNTMKNCTSISLLNIAELPEELNCPNVTFFYMKTKAQFSIPSNFFKGMPNLEVLHLILTDLSPLPASLRSLTKLRTLYLKWSNGGLGDIATIIGDLKNLEILVLSKDEKIEQQLPEEIGQLKHMKLLDLRNCSFFIPPNVISKLTQLEELYMGYWYDQKQVEELDIEKSVASLEELNDFSHLTALDIHVADAEILPKGFVFQKLNRYKIYIGEVQSIWPFHTWRETSRSLTVKSDTNICSEDGVIKGLKGIEDLCLDGEQRVNNVLSDLDGEGFPKLKHFGIRNNPYIICIVDSLPSATCDAFPLLETLSLSNLASLEKICPDQLTTKSFCQLRTIKVEHCDKLKNLFSLSIAKHLSQLQEIEVVGCRNIEEIFIDDSTENGVIDPVFVNQLHSLTLISLPRLRRICSEAEVASTSQERQMQMPLRMDSSSNEIISEDQLDALPLFGEKVVFPNLKNLKLKGINLKKIWPNQLPSLSCCVQSLTSLIVSRCSNLEYMFSLSTLGSFKLLQHLEINDCKNLEELIRIDDECSNYVEFPSLKKLQIGTCPELKKFNFNDKVSFPSLLEIYIHSMKNLKTVWQNQLTESVQYCPKLCKVDIWRCQSLENIFPASIAKSLLQLEELNVSHCKGIKEIVAKEELAEEADVRFAFPQLTSLNLCSLTELKCFYPGKHTTEWPKLNELKVMLCENIDIFNKLQKNDEEGKLDVPMQQPLFVVDKAFTNLKKMTTNRNHVQNQFPKHFFPQLKFLEIESDKSSVLSLDILESFHNLEELKLSYSSYKDIFSYEEVEKYKWTLGKLKSLHLESLDSLKQMWKQDSKMDLILQKLEFLEVSFCDGFINLMPPSASFENIKILKVWGCNRLISLAAASTVKSLVQLEEMSISSCEEMTEIIANEGDVMEDKITFTRLKSLELEGLKNLTSFCSGNYSFNFPLLEKLTVSGCPKIQFFSSRFSSMPKLQKVCYERTYYNCEGADLNTLLKQNRATHQERRVFSILEKSKLWRGDLEMVWKHFPEREKVFSNAKEVCLTGNDIQMIWRSQQFPKHIFPKLKSLEILSDESSVLSLDILESFHNLKELKLKRSSYKEIFSYEEVEKYAGTLGKLKSLHLESLGNLKQMWKQDSKMDLILQKLEFLEVSWCGRFVNLMPPSASFENLKILKVSYCSKLKSLAAALATKGLVQLEEMSISYCWEMTEIIANEGDVMEDKITFTKLKSLELKGLTNLTSFCSGNYSFNFPLLEKLTVNRCPKIQFFSSRVLSKPKLQKVCYDWKDYNCEGADLNTLLKQHQEREVFSILEQRSLTGDDLETVWQHFPERQKVFSNTEEVELKGNDIQMIWRSQQFPKHIFPKLKLLEVRNDESTVVPFGFFQIFHNMKELELRICSYEEIFSHEELQKHAGELPQMKRLRLYRLDDLEKMWKPNSKLDLILQNLETLQVESCRSLINVLLPSSSFENLKVLNIIRCGRLTSLSAVSTAKSLEQLEEMQIYSCQMMTKVIANEGDATENEIIFHKLKKLELKDLSSLTSFSSGNDSFKFPLLEKLVVKECPNMKIFSSGDLSTPMLREVFFREKLSFGNIKMILQKFPEHEKVFSNLEQLSFSRDEIKMIWENQFPQQYLFPELKLVEVSEDASTVFPLSILQRFHSVEKLELNCGSYEEIFSCEDVEKHAGMLAKIKSLSLYRLDDLAQLWKRDPKVDQSLPNLEFLLVEWCGSLVSLVPPSTSFRNLTDLSVKGCHRLRSFVTPSTAKSLVQLNSVKIKKCNMMTEVISSNDRIETGDEIIFSKLTSLHLDGLSSLTSFCSGNYTFNFPFLYDLTLRNCPKIKFFSSGVLNTPKLKNIKHHGKEYFCDGDLNATIHETLNAKTSPEDCAGPSALSPFSASSSAN